MNLSVFIITTDDEKGKRRQENVLKCLNKFSFKSVEFVFAPKVEGSYVMKIAYGYIYLLKKIILESTKKEFFPVLILEDDVCDWNDHIHKYQNVDFPENADLIYLGASIYSAHVFGGPIIPSRSDWHNWQSPSIYCEEYKGGEYWLKLGNMLSTHAIIYVTPKAVLYAYSVIIEAIIREVSWDVLMATTVQPMVNCYIAKYPWFYQDGKVGGQEEPTKIFPKIKNEIILPTIFNLNSNKYVMCAKLFDKCFT